MPPYPFSGRFLRLAFAVLIAVLAFASDAPAQYSGFCSDTCRLSDPCDTRCTECVEEGIDYCARTASSTCGQSGICGGCEVTNSWTETAYYRFGPLDNGAKYCVGREYWYGHTNWSQYQRYLTEIRRTNYETTTCNGVSTTRQVSSGSEIGDCYEFVESECAPYQYLEPWDIHGHECYWPLTGPYGP